MNLIFRGYDALGDFMSNNGMIRYLSNSYDIVKVETTFPVFVNNLFRDNKNIQTIFPHDVPKINSNDNYDHMDVLIHDNVKPLGVYKTLYNKHYKYGNVVNQTINNNASEFYSTMGLDVNLRIDNFYYERDLIKENDLYNSLSNEKYTLICQYDNCLINRKYISDNNIINIHKMSDNICTLIKLIEEAEEVHLVENSIALLVYHMQHKNLMKDVKINLHTYSRKEPHRICNGPDFNNFYLNMLMYPKLSNWNFIYE